MKQSTMPWVIRGYTGFQLFFSLLLWMPIFYEVQKHFGLNDPQIFGIQSIYYVAFCLFEAPTGYFADRFGYRTSMLGGAGVLAMAHMLPILLPSYHGFLWHFLGIALGRSLVSGAASAYLYEFMASHGQTTDYKRVEADARFVALVGRVIAWAVVGALVSWSYMSPYWLSAVGAVLAFVCVWRLPVVAPPKYQGALTVQRPNFAGTALAAARAVVQSPWLTLVIVQGVAVFILDRLFQVNLYQPILAAKAVAVNDFGWIMSIMTVCEAIGSKLAPRLRQRLSDGDAVTLFTTVLGVIATLLGFAGRMGTVTALAFFAAASGVVFPIQRQRMNDAIKDASLRASILSFESIVDRAFCALVFLPLGSLLAEGRLASTVVTVGMIAIALALGLKFIGQRVLPGD